MITKANQVSKRISDRMERIRAMQESFLQKSRENKPKSSGRQGRKLSDSDFETYSKQIRQNI